MSINSWGTIALVVGWLGGALFLFPYMTWVKRWWHEEHRVHVVAFSLDVWLFFTLYLLRPLINPSVFQYIRLTLLWVLALLAAWRAFIFLRGLRRTRHQRTDLHNAVQSDRQPPPDQGE